MAVLALTILLLISAAALLLFRPHVSVGDPIAGQRKHIPLLGGYVPIQQGVPLSPYPGDYFQMGEDGRMQYLGEQSTVFGIDVSSHQGKIDWQKVAADDVKFAILRVGSRGNTYGQLFRDARFEENYAGAVDTGLSVGAYFFSQAITPEEAVEEAELLLEILDGRPLQYPVVFDWEYVSEEARTGGLDPAIVSACCNAFCSTIEKAGYTPMVYFNLYTAYLYYDLAQVLEYDFWAAQFASRPTFYYAYTMLQYSCTGRVDGIRGDVDLNLSFVDYAAQNK